MPRGRAECAIAGFARGKNADIASRFLVFFGKYNDLDDRIGEDLRNEVNHLTEYTLRCAMEDGRDDQIPSRDQ